MACGGHEKQPGGGDESEELERRGRGRNVERKEGEKEEEDVLQVRLFELVFLQVAQTIPNTKGGVETGDILDALISSVGLCSGATTAVITLREAVQEGQVEVLGQEIGQLGFSREGSGTIRHDCACAGGDGFEQDKAAGS